MPYRETLPRRGIPRRQMMKRVARFSRLKGFDGGLPDSRMPGCERILYNVIGFQPPEGEGEVHSPVGAEAARMAAIPISEGFNLLNRNNEAAASPFFTDVNTFNQKAGNKYHSIPTASFDPRQFQFALKLTW